MKDIKTICLLCRFESLPEAFGVTRTNCPAQVALPVPASRSLTDEQLRPIAVFLVTPRGKCLEVDLYKRLREKKCRSWTLRVAMHLRDLPEKGTGCFCRGILLI